MALSQRLNVVFLGLFLAFGGLVARLYSIQVWRHEEFDGLADRQIKRVSQRFPLRGMILDRHGAIMAMSLDLESCFADPSQIKDPAQAAQKLAPLVGLSSLEIRQKINRSKSSFVWIKRKCEPELTEKIRTLDLAGIGLSREEKRYYLQEGLGVHLLGGVGIDNQGLSGIEYIYDKQLRGDSVREMWERDARGRGLLNQTVASRKPQDVLLTIDKTIQYIVEQELERAFQQTRSQAGMALVQDVRTGEILAMANRPHVRQWSAEDFPVSLLKNPSVSYVFEPGSTFKIVTAAAALEEGVVNLDEVFDCEQGRYRIVNTFIHDHEKKGLLTFSQLVEYSSNIGIAKVAHRLGRDKLYTYARAFGFGSPTGIALGGESMGILRSPRQWSGISSAMISFGQEVGVTALQLTNAFSAVANGGYLLEPRVVLALRDADGRLTGLSKTTVIRQVITPKTAKTLAEILEGVVARGTGTAAEVPGYRVAGKTGTAQKIDPQLKRYSPTKFIASFCGFLPADRPVVTITVILDEPQGIYWGGDSAAPVFSRIGLRLMHALNIPPDDSSRVVFAEARSQH